MSVRIGVTIHAHQGSSRAARQHRHPPADRIRLGNRGFEFSGSSPRWSPATGVTGAMAGSPSAPEGTQTALGGHPPWPERAKRLSMLPRPQPSLRMPGTPIPAGRRACWAGVPRAIAGHAYDMIFCPRRSHGPCRPCNRRASKKARYHAGPRRDPGAHTMHTG